MTARFPALGLIVASVMFQTVFADNDLSRYRAATDKPFDEVLFDLEFVITEHNFRITGRNQIGEAINQRDHTRLPRSTIVHFCNLSYARRLLERSADALLHMPCRIAVSERNGQVIVEARLVTETATSSRTLVDEINQLLRVIVDETVAQ